MPHPAGGCDGCDGFSLQRVNEDSDKGRVLRIAARLPVDWFRAADIFGFGGAGSVAGWVELGGEENASERIDAAIAELLKDGSIERRDGDVGWRDSDTARQQLLGYRVTPEGRKLVQDEAA